jgi:hypothetical protein
MVIPFSRLLMLKLLHAATEFVVGSNNKKKKEMGMVMFGSVFLLQVLILASSFYN